MLSQKWILIFLITASILCLAFIFVRRSSFFSCPQEDSRICQFINRNKDLDKVDMTAKILINYSKAGPLEAFLQKSEGISALKIEKDSKEILQIILGSKYIYIKDYEDDKWWREQKNKVTNSLVELPVNPETYFTNILSILTDEQTRYALIEETMCGAEQCYRYQLTNPDLDQKQQIFIFFSIKNSLLKSVFMVREGETIKSDLIYEDIPIQEPKEVKIVPVGRNIFVDYIQLRDKKESKNYDYLKQFESERKQSEGITSIEYQAETPTPETSTSL